MTYFTIHDSTGSTNMTNSESHKLIMFNDQDTGTYLKDNIYISTTESMVKTTYLVKGWSDSGKVAQMKIYVTITDCAEQSIAVLLPNAKISMIVNANSSDIYIKSVEKKFLSTNPEKCPINAYSIA